MGHQAQLAMHGGRTNGFQGRLTGRGMEDATMGLKGTGHGGPTNGTQGCLTARGMEGTPMGLKGVSWDGAWRAHQWDSRWLTGRGVRSYQVPRKRQKRMRGDMGKAWGYMGMIHRDAQCG